MKQETIQIAKKAAKIAGVTCLTLGAAAVVTSGAALKALTAGGKYLKDAIKRITAEAPEPAGAEEVN